MEFILLQLHFRFPDLLLFFWINVTEVRFSFKMVKQKHNMDVNPQRLMITQHAHTQNHQTFTLGAFKVNMTLFTVHLSPVSSEQHITRSNGFVLTLKKGLKHADRLSHTTSVRKRGKRVTSV